MKKYIRANTDFAGWVKALRRDRRKVAALDPDTTTYEDLKAMEWSGGRFPEILIAGCEKRNESVEECIDKLLEQFEESIQWNLENLAEQQIYNQNVAEIEPMISEYLDDYYNVIDQTEHGWIIEPPANATQQDCIEFVDNFRKAIKGEYFGTGHGGSWSVWDLLSEDHVYIKAGWTSDDMWFVEIQDA